MLCRECLRPVRPPRHYLGRGCCRAAGSRGSFLSNTVCMAADGWGSSRALPLAEEDSIVIRGIRCWGLHGSWEQPSEQGCRGRAAVYRPQGGRRSPLSFPSACLLPEVSLVSACWRRGRAAGSRAPSRAAWPSRMQPARWQSWLQRSSCIPCSCRVGLWMPSLAGGQSW